MTKEMHEVRAMAESPIGNLGPESLAFLYGVAHIDKNQGLVDEIDQYVLGQSGPDGVALRTIMGLTMAEAFSDSYLTWRIPGDPPKDLQSKTTEWIVEGLTSEELTDQQRTLVKSVVINLLGRIAPGDSILDEEHGEKIIEAGKITEEELVEHQQELIEHVQESAVKGLMRELWGRV